GGQDGRARIRLAEQGVVHGGPIAWIARDPHAAGGVALRIEVDEKRAVLPGGEGGGQVDRRRRLAHPALLVHDREHQRHAPSPSVVRREYHAGPTSIKEPVAPSPCAKRGSARVPRPASARSVGDGGHRSMVSPTGDTDE